MSPKKNLTSKTVSEIVEGFDQSLKQVDRYLWYGKVKSVVGLLIEVVGLNHRVRLGSLVHIQRADGEMILGEVVGFREKLILVMGYDFLEGVQPGSDVLFFRERFVLRPSVCWRGRVMDALARPLDGKGSFFQGQRLYAVRNAALPSQERRPSKERVDLGVKALNTFTLCTKGQRLGIFAAAGVGKSVLLGQIARFSEADVVIIGLVGERGREVNEFIEEQLGPQGLARSIMVVATSDMPALLRRQAAYTTLTLAEYFRDQGLNVLCIIDSVTRFAVAQREIGLSVGEPPTTRGYPPTVFSELPRLLERAGTSQKGGAITGIFSVLMEGDDPNEPVSDCIRSILDGHIVLDREMAEKGIFPAINVLKSLSRNSAKAYQGEEASLVKDARRFLAIYGEMADMIQLGAYKAGSSGEIDHAIAVYPKLLTFLSQGPDEHVSLEQSFQDLKKVLS